jgi:hypothetical protein
MTAKNAMPDVLAETMRVFIANGRKQNATAAELGIARSTLQQRLVKIKLQPEDIAPTFAADIELRERLRVAESALKSMKKETLDEKYIKHKIIGLSEKKPHIPGWLVGERLAQGSPGVPTLFASDWHFGEVVDPAQVGGVNEYDLTIANDRARRLINNAIDLLTNHMVNPDYPGIVFALGGDMVSGDIHDELVATNEAEIMPVVLELWGVLIWCIETLADHFGKVFVPCVSGNHARNTQKIRAKGRNFTSFDWLVYQFLAKHFEGDARVAFCIPDGPDAYYRIFCHRYLLSHGDQFRGGDGMIGCLGPIIRGDHKKRSRNAQIDRAYDTLLIGHWHQLIQMRRLIVNGALVGYSEYANQNNFGFEPPQQALWITHPDKGITFQMNVYADECGKQQAMEWCQWAA